MTTKKATKKAPKKKTPTKTYKGTIIREFIMAGKRYKKGTVFKTEHIHTHEVLLEQGLIKK